MRCRLPQPVVILALFGWLLVAGTSEPGLADEAEPSRYAPSILLPDSCTTPDGQEVLLDGSLLLAAPNFTDDSKPGVILKITADNRVEPYYYPATHPESKKVYPMGIRAAANGDLYVADCQTPVTPQGGSRLLRIVVRERKPTETVVVAKGLDAANGVALRDRYVYLTDSHIGTRGDRTLSAVFRFRLDEQDVMMRRPLSEDPHCVAVFETENREIAVGADGIAVDSRGNLFVANCGDAFLHKLTLNDRGDVISNEKFAEHPLMKSADGLYCDPKTDTIYVADILGNAIFTVGPDGAVQLLCSNDDCDGADGSMDAPSEAIVRGSNLIIANFDRVFPGSVNTNSSKPCTLSVFPLPTKTAK